MRPQFLEHSRLPGPRTDAFQWRRGGEKEAGNNSAKPTTATAAIHFTTSTTEIYSTAATTAFPPTTATTAVTSTRLQ